MSSRCSSSVLRQEGLPQSFKTVHMGVKAPFLIKYPIVRKMNTEHLIRSVMFRGPSSDTLDAYCVLRCVPVRSWQ